MPFGATTTVYANPNAVSTLRHRALAPIAPRISTAPPAPPAQSPYPWVNKWANWGNQGGQTPLNKPGVSGDYVPGGGVVPLPGGGGVPGGATTGDGPGTNLGGSTMGGADVLRQRLQAQNTGMAAKQQQAAQPRV